MGPQYRSVIFYPGIVSRSSRKRTWTSYVRRGCLLRSDHAIAPLAGYYEAEPYHQDYAARNPRAPYIVRFDLPKVEELRKQFPPAVREVVEDRRRGLLPWRRSLADPATERYLLGSSRDEPANTVRPSLNITERALAR